MTVTRGPIVTNPLKRDGTHQFQRLAQALEEDYVKIEDRSEQELLHYAARLAQHIQYYNEDNVPDGDWSNFFEGADSKPQKALFLGFVKLLSLLHEFANGLTRRHLDYYYKEVLDLVKQEAEPAQVHVFFTIADGLKEKFLAKGTQLNAGKTADGKPLLYELAEEIVVNQARITEVRSQFMEGESFGKRAFVNTNAKIPLHAEEPGPYWSLFGETQLVPRPQGGGYQDVFKPTSEQSMAEAEIGFALASPLLTLAEGERTITLRINTLETKLPNGESTFDELFRQQFDCFLSGDQGWYKLENNTDKNGNPITRVTATKRSNTGTGAFELTLVFTLIPTDPPITPYHPALHTGRYKADHPLLKVVFRHPKEEVPTVPFGYAAWHQVKVSSVELQTEAKRVRNLMVQNDIGSIEPSKPFRPFGLQPVVGSHCYIGHPEIFRQGLSALSLQLRWKDAPQNLGTYYKDYAPDLSNESFTAGVAVLEDYQWESLTGQEPKPIFSTTGEPEVTLTLPNEKLKNLSRKENPIGEVEWGFEVPHSYLRLTLAGPDAIGLSAFGHNDYAKLVSQNQSGDPISVPYTPLLAEITLDYTTEVVTWKAEEEDSPFESLAQVTPFGTDILPVSSRNQLFPQYPAEGYFYLGLQSLNLPQSLSLLFQMEEGTGDSDANLLDTQVRWSYLSGATWKPLERFRISKDTTGGLLHSGILRMELPEDVSTEHHFMPAGTAWLRAEIPQGAGALDRVLEVHVQAMEATRINPDEEVTLLEPNTIQGLAASQKGISSVDQPYVSFGGKSTELPEGFYSRVSERIRHRDRAANVWDYERLVLDQFPDIYKVKCLNHTHLTSEFSPGNVLVAVIPNVRRHGIANVFRPKVGALRRSKIHEYLQARVNPFLNLHVANPIYEPLRIYFNVGFYEGRDEGFYGRKLFSELQQFLSPWAFEEGHDLPFGGKTYKSTLVKYMEDREYVDFVNDFTMYHVYRDPGLYTRVINQTTDAGAPYDTVPFFFQPNEGPPVVASIRIQFYRGVKISKDGTKTAAQQLVAELTTIFQNAQDKGEEVTKNRMLSIMKGLFYVDNVVGMDYYLLLPDDVIMEDTDVAQARTARSILVSSEQHRINVYKPGDYNCEGTRLIGIGQMVVQVDFIVD